MINPMSRLWITIINNMPIATKNRIRPMIFFIKDPLFIFSSYYMQSIKIITYLRKAFLRLRGMQYRQLRHPTFLLFLSAG